jgi:CRP-like cAMP-binding protein
MPIANLPSSRHEGRRAAMDMLNTYAPPTGGGLCRPAMPIRRGPHPFSGPAAPMVPRTNGLLAAMEGDFLRLQPELQRVQLTQGQVLIDAGRTPNHVYFPTTAAVALMTSTRSGGCAELAVVGSEGMVGMGVMTGGGASTHMALVRSSGFALRLNRHAFKQLFDRGGPLTQMMLRYTQALMNHFAQAAVCNLHHSVDQRLSRCLLDSMDRTVSGEMPMTHESIALWLGVRRESVTLSTRKLQRDGVIAHARGRITVIDRPALEARSCECYTVVREEYARLATSGLKVA